MRCVFGELFDLVDTFGRKGPVVFATPLDGIAAHLIDVEQQFVPVAGGVVEHGVVE